MTEPDVRADADIYRKSSFCSELRRGDAVDEVFCLTRIDRKVGRNGPFLTFVFADRTGEVPGIAWDDVDRIAEGLSRGAFVRVRGQVNEYRDAPQIVVTGARVESRVDPAEYLPRSPVPLSRSIAGIRAIVASMKDRDLRVFIESFLDDPVFLESFSIAPAAKVNHHAYVGGLAEHTCSVMTLCSSVAETYPEVDRDLLLAGAFLHDLGKIEELAVEPGFPYTERGSLVGHIAIGHAMLRERLAPISDFPPEKATDLEHLLLSHQGELEWGSPVKPQTVEAIILHFLDNLDSKVGLAEQRLAQAGDDDRTPYIPSIGRSLFRRGDRLRSE